MKKLLYILLSSLSATAQYHIPHSTATTIDSFKGALVARQLIAARTFYCDPFADSINSVALINSVWYYMDSTTRLWLPISGGGGGITVLSLGAGIGSSANPLTGPGTLWVDSIRVAYRNWATSQLNLKLNIADTPSMLGGYERMLAAMDTFAAHWIAIQARLTAESDPFSPHLASTYVNPSWIFSLAWSKITGAPSFLTAEVDPVFLASIAYNLTAVDTTHYNTAYNKYPTNVNFNTTTGVLTITLNDGSTLTKNLDGRYLTSYTETDPVYLASIAYNLTAVDTTHYNTAYNKYPTAVNFNTGTGLFTMTLNDGSTLTKNMDGRYLTSYTETDPVFLASIAFNLTAVDTTHYNTAYQKYTVSGSFSAGTITFVRNDGGTWTVTGLVSTSTALSAFAVPTADISMSSHKLTNVTDPSSAQDAMTKGYADAHYQVSGSYQASGNYITYSDTTISANYTLTSRDLFRSIHCSNSSNINLTIPTGLGSTFRCEVIQENTGTVTPLASGTTLDFHPSGTKTNGGAILVRMEATTDKLLIQGSIQ